MKLFKIKDVTFDLTSVSGFTELTKVEHFIPGLIGFGVSIPSITFQYWVFSIGLNSHFKQFSFETEKEALKNYKRFLRAYKK